MKWVVGLDLRPYSQGAVRFATWLSKNSKAEEGESLVGVHVLEEEHLRVVLRYHHLDEVTEGALASAKGVLSTAGAGDVIQDVFVVRGVGADQSLAAARVYHHADAIVVGRQAKRDSNRVVRLGRVARRLLRALPSPVVVVPPDVTEDDLGDGPVVVMTNLTDDSVSAAHFGQDMAARLGRSLVLVHVVPLPEEYGAQYLPAGALDKLRKEHQDEGQREMDAWVQKHGLAGVETVCLQGQVVERTVGLCEERKSPLLVCGSRRLNTLERVLLTSVATEACAVATHAVAVVPPPA